MKYPFFRNSSKHAHCAPPTPQSRECIQLPQFKIPIYIYSMIDRDIKIHLNHRVIQSSVPNKSQIATHFLMKGFVEYYGLTEAAEIKLITLLAQAHETGVPMYFHEIFSSKFSLVFDIDGPQQGNSDILKRILAAIFTVNRTIFNLTSPADLYCIVFSACSEEKLSYHIIFPSIVVNKQVACGIYENIFKKDNTLRNVIDEQILTSRKLRMPFSDKYNSDTGKPEGRKLSLFGIYDHKCTRISPDWENDTHEILYRGKVRRSQVEDYTPVRMRCTDALPLENTPLEELGIDLDPYEEADFNFLPDEYYSLEKIQVVVEHLKRKYWNVAAEMCSKLVRYMNNFVGQIGDHQGKILFVIKKFNQSRKQQKFTFIKKHQRDFVLYFQHIKVFLCNVGDSGTRAQCRSIGDIWIQHPEKKCYSQIVFDPRPDYDTNVSKDFNVYQGPCLTINEIYEATDGMDYMEYCQPILRHIREVWCADEDHVYEYVLNWLAHAILYPWIKIKTALVLQGNEGCGKSGIVDAIFSRVFGAHYLHVMDMEDLVGKFNHQSSEKLMIFGDEAFWAGCKSFSGKLKALITENVTRCEQKGIDAYTTESFTNYILASNHYWVVPAGENARRWCCLACTSKYNNNTQYFSVLHKTLSDQDGLGVKCFIRYLEETIDLTKFIPSKIPKTKLLREQKENSFDSLESFWDSVLHRGHLVDWTTYNEYDAEFDMMQNCPGIVQYTKEGIYSSQKLPFQKIYATYKDEMSGAGLRLCSPQRFKQFLKGMNLYIPIAGRREVWLRFDFPACREMWRKRLDDPDLTFECEQI